MKKLILLELALLFLATTFQSDNPPGWYQQTLPVNDNINDIFFLDSLNGWAVTYGRINPPDTAYILKTTNGGDNWNVQFSNVNDFLSIQFANENTGYACGGFGIGTLFKSTNGGTNWNNITFGSTNRFNDLVFINKDTGWVCSSDSFDGGVFKTTDGGLSWVQQVNLTTANPQRIFFVNNEIGWIGNEHRRLYKTTNSGVNWNLQYTFPQTNSNVRDILFTSADTGWISESYENNIQFSSNGGTNWISQSLPAKGGIIAFSQPEKFSSIDGKNIWGGGGTASFGMGRFRGIIYKSSNSGTNWYYQIPDTSIHIFNYTNIQFINDSLGWASNTGMIHTTDGGGTLVSISNSEFELPGSFVLSQNYPNPFNPKTKINYEIKNSGFINLTVYDIRGSKISVLINKKQNPGNYETEFDGSHLNSGVYFYSLFIDGEKMNTKKMVLVR
ncbi:MAG: T9SS type A sorting domain-containing protein [Ignavibacteria bacterium]